MRFIMSGLLLVVALIFTPKPAVAQVGHCYICDETCQGAHNGSEQCAQTAPGECDMYGDVCEPQFALTEIDAAGTLSQRLADAFAGSNVFDGSEYARRACDNAILARSYKDGRREAILKQARIIDL